jgi:hypothetical protein
MLSETELRRREAELDAREGEISRRESAAQDRSLRRNPYEHVTLSKRALDAIIVVCALLIAAFATVGAIYGG